MKSAFYALLALAGSISSEENVNCVEKDCDMAFFFLFFFENQPASRAEVLEFQPARRSFSWPRAVGHELISSPVNTHRYQAHCIFVFCSR